MEVGLGSCGNVGAQHDKGYSVESEYFGVGTLECTTVKTKINEKCAMGFRIPYFGKGENHCKKRVGQLL